MKDEQIILTLMREDGYGQRSWDWPADYKFAKAIKAKDEIEILKALLKSAAPHAFQITIHKLHISKIKNRRLRALGKLVKMGLVDSWWIGTGYGGKSDFGVNRVKTWRLRQ